VQANKALALELVQQWKERLAHLLLVLVQHKANTNFSIDIRKLGLKTPGFFYG
jgi:hypothetical protein